MKQICFSVSDEDREEIQHYEIGKLEKKYGHTDKNRIAPAQQQPVANQERRK